MTTRFEVFPAGSAPIGAGVPVEWGRPPVAEIDSSLDPHVLCLGAPSSQVVDLLRITAGAYVADRLTKRRLLPRDFELTVHCQAPELTSESAQESCTNILRFLTGDRWRINLQQDRSEQEQRTPVEFEGANRVALLSGGLDSFAHAALACSGDDGKDMVFVSHQSNPMTVRAQNSCISYLRSVEPDLRQYGIRLRHMSDKEEFTNHSRSMLFAAMGIAVADAVGAKEVLVPENGFTSLNVPLAPNRQGRYSTRSTHPYTFYLFNRLLGEIGLDVTLVNPHEWQTKGVMVEMAAEAGGDAFLDAAARTLSCGKLDGRFYAGGNANIGCGLCYACMVRRASFAAAGVEDQTSYLADTLVGPSLTDLRGRRLPDMRAVRQAISTGVDEDELLANTPLPPGYDLDQALRLWQDGLDELALLELPLE